MTIPSERSNAIDYARDFMWRLLDKKATPRVPLAIRQEARARLKHYPSEWEVSQMKVKCPEILG